MAFNYAPGQSKSKEPEDLPVRIRPFDVDAAKREFEPYRKKILAMKEIATAFEVVDDATNAEAVTMMGQARALSKAVTSLKDKKLRPHNDYRTKLISFAKAFSQPAEEAVDIFRKKTEAFAYNKLLKKREEEKKQRRLAEKRQAELNAQAEAAGVEKVTLPQVPVEQKEKLQTRTESGSSLSIEMVWVAEITNPDKVDRVLCSPDPKKIQEAVDAGLRNPQPGLDIKEVPKSKLRA